LGIPVEHEGALGARIDRRTGRGLLVDDDADAADAWREAQARELVDGLASAVAAQVRQHGRARH
jgi:hypothetical protein